MRKMSVFLPVTRRDALARLEAFLPLAPAYGATRNHVVPGHENISRLSPATRTRVLLEREILAAVRDRDGSGASAKFEQEVWWRLYWKGWLEQRPCVWTAYRQSLARLEWSDRGREVAAGASGVAILDHFTRELVTTGYLHNHARMWWASWWIHGEGLPWELGAHFFLRHLRDGDAASNTLSWRWVAGLHTRGKAYLV
ncbi:MAG: DNA photolyase, partial [Verrucomicrobia bacterium]|nr:DNA photolyase [Verrucomicrobiota bacterium]